MDGKISIRKSSLPDCPYCRESLSTAEVQACKECGTVLHRECFAEAKACTTLGCSGRGPDWPRCASCGEDLKSLGAVLCTSCGYHQQERRHLRTSTVVGAALGTPLESNQEAPNFAAMLFWLGLLLTLSAFVLAAVFPYDALSSMLFAMLVLGLTFMGLSVPLAIARLFQSQDR